MVHVDELVEVEVAVVRGLRLLAREDLAQPRRERIVLKLGLADNALPLHLLPAAAATCRLHIITLTVGPLLQIDALRCIVAEGLL